MRCVFDENLPIKLCKALNFLEGDHGITVKHMTELVDPSTPDEDWIKIVGKDCLSFVVTKDNKIKTNIAELAAWKESELSIVFLQDSWFNLDFWDICWKFIKIWPEVKRTINRNIQQKTLMIHVQGKVEEIGVTYTKKAKRKAG